jgi:hypothetical protein
MRRGLKTRLATLAGDGRMAAIVTVMALAASLTLFVPGAEAVDDSYRPPSDAYTGQSGVDSYGSAPPSDTYRPPASNAYRPPADNGQNDTYRPYDGSARGGSDPGGYGEPYHPPQNSAGREEYYPAEPPPAYGPPPRGEYTEDEIVRAGNNFFGKVSGGLASAVEWAFHKVGRPNGYILGQGAGGAFIAGLSYGEGRLYTKDAGTYKVYWQGPSLGYDFGADGSKVMTLVYNLRDPSDIYTRFGGIEGTAYLIGGVSAELQKAGHVTLVPIRAGVGLRLGANVGYAKYTRYPTWNPF